MPIPEPITVAGELSPGVGHYPPWSQGAGTTSANRMDQNLEGRGAFFKGKLVSEKGRGEAGRQRQQRI